MQKPPLNPIGIERGRNECRLNESLGAGGGGPAKAGARPLRLRDRGAGGRDGRLGAAAAVDAAAIEDDLDLVAGQGLIFQQCLGERLQLLAVLVEKALGAV